ncbi:hypothetical protein [Bdellovibrio bacteriovorus]|nr:hypothetical protein [Bdellovibrio bacteriovorus]
MNMKKEEVLTTESGKVENWERWWHALSISDTLLSRAEEDPSLKEICNYLESIEVVFEDACDPADDFKAYAIRSLCQAVRRTLNNKKEMA